MPSTALVRLTEAIAWELRGAWAKGYRIALTVDPLGHVEGHVSTVSPTGAYAVVGGVLCPLDRVLAVHRPSRLGDSTYDGHGSWSGPVPDVLRNRDPNQLTLDEAIERGSGKLPGGD